jgi:circadian clock protein KaiA
MRFKPQVKDILKRRAQDRRDLLQSLERTYRDLLISYFRDPAAANQALESFVHTAFFTDLPITKAVEIHTLCGCL